MSKDKLILKDGTTIELESGSSLDAIKAATENREALEAGQEIQNGAISDLGSVTSAIAEQIGGEE